MIQQELLCEKTSEMMHHKEIYWELQDKLLNEVSSKDHQRSLRIKITPKLKLRYQGLQTISFQSKISFQI